MPFVVCAQFIQRQPVRGDDPVIQPPAEFDLIQTAIKGKTQIGCLTRRYSPLVDTHQRLRVNVTTRFLKGLARTGRDQRFALIQMPGRLIETKSVRGFFFDDEKTAILLDKRRNGDTRFPAVFWDIHKAYFTETSEKQPGQTCVGPDFRMEIG